MKHKYLYTLLFVIFFASPAFGFEPERNNPIGQMLFKPELIMRFSNRLDLSDQQQDILKAELKDAQAVIFDYKWQLNEESEKLKAILMTHPIDEEQLLAQSDKVIEIEHQIKRVHLTLLARLKNMLSVEQVKMLRELRRKDRRNGGR